MLAPPADDDEPDFDALAEDEAVAAAEARAQTDEELDAEIDDLDAMFDEAMDKPEPDAN